MSNESRIKNLEEKLKLTKNDIERAEIADKINTLKKESNYVEHNKEVNEHSDAPSVADHDESFISLSRGQIMNSGNTFTVGL